MVCAQTIGSVKLHLTTWLGSRQEGTQCKNRYNVDTHFTPVFFILNQP